MKYNIGIDFDNTIVSYDNIMHKTAVEWGLIDSKFKRNKKEIRDKIRQLSEGETAWQKIQIYVYGKAMSRAVLVEGVIDFFHACKNAGIPAFIISHKTEYARLDKDNINLRDAALSWMKSNNFFKEEGLGLSRDQVYFESTRQEKINRIKQLGCTHFIDDLEETFLEESFPQNVERILYTSMKTDLARSGVKVFGRWEEIQAYLFKQTALKND